MQKTFKASDLFFSQRDVFLNMTIFVSLKTLFKLRQVCKSFNSWLSDPNTFSWQKRIEAAFPLSYEDVLKETMLEQFQRLMTFDGIVEAGHQVLYYSLGDLTAVKTKEDYYQRANEKRLQLPWRKDLFIFGIANTNTTVLFSTATRSNIAQIDLPWNPSRILFDITNHKIGFLSSRNDLKTYHVMGNDLVHELDFSLTINSRCLLSNSQIYGDHLLLESDDGEETHLTLFSISKNMEVSDISLESDRTFSAVSMLEPVIYFVCQDLPEVCLGYTIYKVNCIQGTVTELCENKLNVEYDSEGDGVQAVELIEDEESTVIKVYQHSCVGSAVDLIDIKNQRVIFSQYYDDDNNDVYAKSESYYSEAWKHLQYNLGTSFYSTMSHGPSGQVVTIGRVDQPFYTADEPLVWDIDIDEMPDEPAVFSKFFNVTGTMTHSQDFRSRWLNNDILAFQVQSSTREYYGRQTNLKRLKPTNWVESFWSRVPYSLMFYSVGQKRVVGCIYDEIKEIFVDGNNVIAFNKENGVYDIKLDMNYYENSRRGKKRKLDAILKEQIKAMKKAKLDKQLK